MAPSALRARWPSQDLSPIVRLQPLIRCPLPSGRLRSDSDCGMVAPAETSTMSLDRELDKWAAWVVHRRDGDDLEQRKRALEHLLPIRDRVLDNARIREGETLLDVGAGVDPVPSRSGVYRALKRAALIDPVLPTTGQSRRRSYRSDCPSRRCRSPVHRERPEPRSGTQRSRSRCC